VEALTDASGDTKATYGYTAYGQNDNGQFTGVDKPDPQDPTKEPYNFYRYTAKRFDPASGTYDMGFRDYSPGLNRFLTRDMYNGALADLDLATDPFTSNRYAFAGGNPISNVELDGHIPAGCDAQCTRDYAAAANAAAQARALADTANNTPTETRAGRGGPPAASDAIPGNAGTDTMCEKLHACPLKLDDKGERLGLCGLSPELLQAALTNQQGHPALPTECLTEQMGLTIRPLANGGFVLVPTPTPGILRSEGGEPAGGLPRDSAAAIPEADRKVIEQARAIFWARAFGMLRVARAKGVAIEVNINGTPILYEPGMKASGMSLFGEKGFVLGPEAFSSEEELAMTVLHETYRLRTTQSSALGASGALVTEETGAAAAFARRYYGYVLGG
jgi:RHS repeat-associated protein